MSKIFDAQDRLVSLLTADPYFSDIPVLSQRKGDLAIELQNQLNLKGLGVLVMLPLLTWGGTANRILLNLLFVVVVSEDPTINQVVPPGTGKPAESVMEKIFQLIHYQPNSTAVNPGAKHTLFMIDGRAGEAVEPTKTFPNLLNYMLRFRTVINLPDFILHPSSFNL